MKFIRILSFCPSCLYRRVMRMQTKRVMRELAAEAMAEADAHPTLRVDEFLDPDIVDMAKGMLLRHRLEMSDLGIEVPAQPEEPDPDEPDPQLPDVPQPTPRAENTTLIENDGIVTRVDARAIGTVRFMGGPHGRSVQVYSVRRSAQTTCLERLFGRRRVFLCSESGRSGVYPARGSLFRAHFGARWRPERPLAPLLRTEHGTLHPADEAVLHAADFLMRG